MNEKWKADGAAFKMLQAVKVKEVTCHFLHGRVIAEVGVSLDPNLSIRYYDIDNYYKPMCFCIFHYSNYEPFCTGKFT
jgi:hypothetical protein